MKIIYDDLYLTNYPTAGVENPGRLLAIRESLGDRYPVVPPEPASLEDLSAVHSPRLVAEVQMDSQLFEVAALAAGGALTAARLALAGEPAFALIRPPGHHASPGSHWGFCFFNNMAVALDKLLREKQISRALVLDIDLHFGDGTVNIFRDRPEVAVVNIESPSRAAFLQEVQQALWAHNDYDLIGVSAGFDTYVKDWGGTLHTSDYQQIGAWVKEAATKVCNGRRFALLEGGYYIPDLGANCLALLTGLD